MPAPLLIDDELLYNYQRPQTLPLQKPYVAGLLELQTRLGVGSKHFGNQRSIVSIEGPGGVGKSALAFQIARWASDSRADYQLARFPILPVLLRSLGSDANKLNNVDEAAADSLRLIMETSKISAPLLQALLRRKRVLVVVDGLSELPKEAADLPIRPDKGAVDTRFLVVTSRLATNLLESLLIRPQGLTIEVLDRVLDDLIAENVGSRRFNDADHQTLRTRIRSLIKGAKERQVPMIFIKPMIEHADQLLNDGKQLDELPTTLAELVTEYTEQLLRNEQNLTLAVQQARIAAHVCMGEERSPAARSENRYTAKGVSKEILDKFVTAGLLVRSGDKSDPFFKFALDPIAEQLDANRLVIDIREERADQTELGDLMVRWEELPEDFVLALRRAAASYRQFICSNQFALSLKLWPQASEESNLAGISFQSRTTMLTRTIRLGHHDTDTYVIEGNGTETIGLHNVILQFTDQYHQFPEEIVRTSHEYADFLDAQPALPGESRPWNGDVAHVYGFSLFERSPNDEDIRLRIFLKKAKYYEFCVTAAILDREFRQFGYAAPTRRTLVGEFTDWSQKVPPAIVNGLPINLFVIVENHIIFGQRSRSLAIGANVIATTINENLHPERDRGVDQRTLDLERLVHRGLLEELGWNEKKRAGTTSEPRAKVAILAFQVWQTTAAYGITGYIDLPISMDEFRRNYSIAKDKGEIEKFNEVRLSTRDLVEFIDNNGLYDATGVTACFCLMHYNSVPFDHLQKEFARVQQSASTRG